MRRPRARRCGNPRCRAVFALLLLLTGCASGPPVLPGYLPAGAAPLVLSDVPFHAQQRYQCGPAALAMSLGASGVAVAPQSLVPKVWIPELKGSLQAEMMATARRYRRVPYVIAPRLPALLTELQAGFPVLVLLNLGWSFYPVWHYAVVIGYLPERDALVLHSGTTRRKIMSTRDFLDNWRKADRWGLVLLRPGVLPAGDGAHRYLEAVAGLEQVHAAAAEPAYEAATRRWPRARATWLGLGNTRYIQGEYADAARAWRTLIRHRSQAPAARNNLAALLAERGCTKAAMTQIETALATAPERLRTTLLNTRADIRARAGSGRACPASLRPHSPMHNQSP